MSEIIRFYFSFRSPYSWLACYRIQLIGNDLPVDFELIPVFPPEDFNNDPTLNDKKRDFITADIRRLTQAYGLSVTFPKQFDTDWIRPHSAFVYAEQQGIGMKFCLAMYAARFIEGKDIGRDEEIVKIAKNCDLDPDETLKASDDHTMQRLVMKGMAMGARDGLFGVPFFIYADKKYWGNDRIEWLLRDIYRDNGKDVPDLEQDPFLRPF